MKWTHKAAVLRLLSTMPGGSVLHFELQRRVTREWPRSREVLQLLWAAAKEVAQRYERFATIPMRRAVFLEIGAGRDLAVPVALRLLGVPRIIAMDVQRIARLDLVTHAARVISELAGATAPDFRSWDELAKWGVEYIAPYDLPQAQLNHSSVDCLYSVDTLEHIPTESLERLFVEANKVVTPSGLSIHLVDFTDHYARSDRTISRFNFLQYSNEEWRRFNPAMHYVNRLRHSDLLALIERCGWRVLSTEPTLSESIPEVKAALAQEFRERSSEDLFTARSWIVSTAAELTRRLEPAVCDNRLFK